MALVSYSDSEASDSEPEITPAPSTATKPTPSSTTATATTTFPTIVDRSNPRKIRIALPDIKENSAPGEEDGPARKKPRIGGGGGAFAGFNSLLPPPKRTGANANANATAEKETEKEKKPGVRKVFSLKTGAAPGFDRGADEEMRRELAFERLGKSGDGDGDGGDDETIPKAGSLRGGEGDTDADGKGDVEVEKKREKPAEVVLKGNPMMFKPLSVGRTQQKKRKTTTTTAIIPPVSAAKDTMVGGGGLSVSQPSVQTREPAATQPAPKPKVSLFSLSTEESSATNDPASAQASTYQPLVYTEGKEDEEAPPPGPVPESESVSFTSAHGTSAVPAQTLDHIADDLNLSRSQRRQLFGRNADPSKSRILHFNTDVEYAANQELAHTADLAAAQHNPVRAIAPGKHTLQQLVNAASSQREALEESFATGKRNKREAGAKYGW